MSIPPAEKEWRNMAIGDGLPPVPAGTIVGGARAREQYRVEKIEGEWNPAWRVVRAGDSLSLATALCYSRESADRIAGALNGAPAPRTGRTAVDGFTGDEHLGYYDDSVTARNGEVVVLIYGARCRINPLATNDELREAIGELVASRLRPGQSSPFVGDFGEPVKLEAIITRAVDAAFEALMKRPVKAGTASSRGDAGGRDLFELYDGVRMRAAGISDPVPDRVRIPEPAALIDALFAMPGEDAFRIFDRVKVLPTDGDEVRSWVLTDPADVMTMVERCCRIALERDQLPQLAEAVKARGKS